MFSIKMSRENDVDRRSNICYDLMLEFICHDVWRRFINGSDMDEGIDELLHGILWLQGNRNSDITRSKEVSFLSLFCLVLNFGKSSSPNNTGNGDMQQQQSNFQHIQQWSDALSSLCNDENVSELVDEVRQETLMQQLFMCCRNGNFDEAEKILEEEIVFLNQDSVRKIQLVLRSKKPSHPLLVVDSRTNYINLMIKYLQTIFETFPDKPFVAMVADDLTKQRKEYRDAKLYTHRSVVESVNDGSLGRVDEEALSSKVKDVREKKRKAAVLSAAKILRMRDSPSEQDSDSNSEPDGDIGQSDRQKGRRPVSTTSTHDDDGSGHISLSSSGSDTENDRDDEVHRRGVDKRPVEHTTRRNKASALADKRPPSHSTKFTKRKRWTGKEEEDFYKAVQRHGVGEWQAIKFWLRSHRSTVQLKDKWRTICNTTYKTLCKRFGPVTK